MAEKNITTETWKDVEGYKGVYQVSTLGKVRRIGMLSTKTSLTNPYPQVKLCKEGRRKTTRVHRLVAKAFIPNPLQLLHVHHKDGDKRNNYVNNLEWTDKLDHTARNIKLGLAPFGGKGEKHSRAVLSETDVLEMRKLHSQGMGVLELADVYNMSQGHTCDILTRKCWKHI